MAFPLEDLARELGEQLKALQLSIVTAESCTGGGLAYWLTSIPGSSAWFERGFVTYTNAAKIELLGVKQETLTQYGAVSSETACAMAAGALKASHAQIAIAITGIAGPDGGSKEKPVGTVWFAIARSHLPQLQIAAEMAVFPGDRAAVRLRAITRALKKLLDTAMMANTK